MRESDCCVARPRHALSSAGTKLFQAICKTDAEGIVAKRKHGVYQGGERWFKIRNRDYSQMPGRHELFDSFHGPKPAVSKTPPANGEQAEIYLETKPHASPTSATSGMSNCISISEPKASWTPTRTLCVCFSSRRLCGVSRPNSSLLT